MGGGLGSRCIGGVYGADSADGAGAETGRSST